MIWWSILGVLPFTLALPYVGLLGTAILSVIIGLILASAHPAIIVYAQSLLPGRVGMVAGLFFGGGGELLKDQVVGAGGVMVFSGVLSYGIAQLVDRLREAVDLLTRRTNAEHLRYDIIHLRGEDIEVAMTHGNQYGEEYYSFVNGQYTTQGGTHLAAFREAVVKTIREFFKKEFDPTDVRKSIVAAVAVKVQEPVFESQTKTKLGSQYVSEGGPSMKSFVLDFFSKELDNYLHKNPATADAMKKSIEQSERERKELSGIRKLANERAKKGVPR